MGTLKLWQARQKRAIEGPMDEVLRLFPTPFMRAKHTLESQLVTDLVAHVVERTTRNNVSSKSLAHTELFKPTD